MSYNQSVCRGQGQGDTQRGKPTNKRAHRDDILSTSAAAACANRGHGLICRWDIVTKTHRLRNPGSHDYATLSINSRYGYHACIAMQVAWHEGPCRQPITAY